MTTTPKNFRRVIAFASVGLALVCTGLSLAVLSNPKRFSINVTDDWYIQLFAIAGLACTLTGILLFLYAVRNTTKSMPAQLRTNANLGVGLGFVLQLAGFFLPEISPISVELALAIIFAGLLAFAWGGMHYVQGKGYSKSFGLLAVFGIPGLVALILLPNRGSNLVANEGK